MKTIWALRYLHPAAVREAFGIDVHFSETDLVADCVAQALLPDGAWSNVSRRGQKRLRYRVKKLLNTRAVDQMTASRLAESDPTGELVGWLQLFSRMLD